MARSQKEKQETHERIVQIAARRLREDGLQGVGVADLMKEAGLTVGGFYKHFGSRDDLVAEAMQAAFEGSTQAMAKGGKSFAELTAGEFAEIYLSESHCAGPGEGCAFAMLTSDLGRSDDKTRAIATARLQRNFKAFEGRVAGEDEAERRRQAIVAVCAMAGAVGLARVSDDAALSKDILDAVKSFVTGMGKDGA